MMPSPTACRGSTERPASVATVEPVCSVALCRASVPPSRSALVKPEPARTPMAFRAPMPAAVPLAITKSSRLGLSRPSLRARAFATGPRTWIDSKSAGPAKAPTAAPPTVPAPGIMLPAAAPTAAPPARVTRDPPSWPACSTTAFGR